MRTSNIWLIGLLAIASPAAAQSDSGLEARRAAVRELMAARNEDKLVNAMAHTMADVYLKRLQQTHPEIAQDRLDALRGAIETDLLASRDDYLRPEAELLSQRLTLEDLQAAIAFYRTPAGQRLAAITPDLVPDVAQTQAAWVNAAIVKATNDVNSKAVK